MTFDFQEALSYIKAGFRVKITINNIERHYYLNQFNEIMCKPNNKDHLAYKVNTFHIDAIMSDNWKLCS